MPTYSNYCIIIFSQVDFSFAPTSQMQNKSPVKCLRYVRWAPQTNMLDYLQHETYISTMSLINCRRGPMLHLEGCPAAGDSAILCANNEVSKVIEKTSIIKWGTYQHYSYAVEHGNMLAVKKLSEELGRNPSSHRSSPMKLQSTTSSWSWWSSPLQSYIKNRCLDSGVVNKYSRNRSFMHRLYLVPWRGTKEQGKHLRIPRGGRFISRRNLQSCQRQ